MERASAFSALKQIKFLLIGITITVAGCSLEKQSGFNRSMQNLTAHYNILFNAKEILRQKQDSYALSFVDNYNEILNVYQDTTLKSTTPDKDLDAAIAKANTIIGIKEQSGYIGDAYLVLGKANYLGGNYFNAVEYFGYVIRSFPKRKDLTQDALVWKARTLMYLDELPAAKLALDTAIQNINPKKKPPADIYATKLQYDINVQDYAGGEEMAKQAINYSHDIRQRLRWTFILAQLQELNQKPAEAIKNYAGIVKSNASFEMAFNASLNRIRIEDKENGVKISRVERLLGLLKDPNNKEFKDQIYYQVAELQMADKDINGAIKNYNLSVRYSIKNQNQKGLSYLRLAEINFKIKADYVTAKKYYDSTLTSLSPAYQGYRAIQKLSNNLQLLTDRLQIITREDTLQALARMDEKTRLAVIDKMVNDKILQQQAITNAAAANANINATSTQVISTTSGSAFYFYNSNAVSQGYSDFKRKWGNRKLEDNWRRSNRANSDITTNTSNIVQNTDPDAPVGQQQTGKSANGAASYRQELLKGLPLTPTLLAQSNLRMYNAYVDVGNFYRDILDDKKEAIAIYELILRRFPDDPNKPAIYYNLYRLYSELDHAKSDMYKNKLLKDYADTPFAKIISDPDYVKKLGDVDAEVTDAYNQVFDLYARKKYKEVIACVPDVLARYPGNKFSAQLYYLQAISAGHYEKVQPFEDSLKHVLNRYPNDRLISPLITQHLTYINTNHADLLARNTVLADDDPHDVPFTLDQSLKEQTEYRRPPRQGGPEPKAEVKLADTKQPVTITPAATTGKTTQPNKVAANNVIAAPTLFSMNDSTNYYFAINVNSSTTNLSSSRFGIGQFNRANYPGNGIKHQLLAIGNDNQLIFVGRFLTLDGVKKYARAIIPLLPDIIKVPKDKYSFFIITQENLNKLADQKTLDAYLDYYQKNY